MERQKKYRNVKLKMIVSRKEKNILMTLIVTAVRTFRRNEETYGFLIGKKII